MLKDKMWYLIFLWQIACCLGTCKLLRVTKQQLTYYFPSITNETENRQKYIVKNVTKSILLLFLTPPGLWVLNRIVFYNTWDSDMIKCLGSLYCCSDLIALATMYDKLPPTTKIHHICVAIFSFLNTFVIDYENPDYIWRNTAMLAACSAPTYGVNTFLGVRCIKDVSNKEKVRLAKFALGVYSFFITLSFTWQCYTLLAYPVYYTWSSLPYVVAMTLIYWDDYHLSRYLFEYKP